VNLLLWRRLAASPTVVGGPGTFSQSKCGMQVSRRRLLSVSFDCDSSYAETMVGEKSKGWINSRIVEKKSCIGVPRLDCLSFMDNHWKGSRSETSP